MINKKSDIKWNGDFAISMTDFVCGIIGGWDELTKKFESTDDKIIITTKTSSPGDKSNYSFCDDLVNGKM